MYDWADTAACEINGFWLLLHELYVTARLRVADGARPTGAEDASLPEMWRACGTTVASMVVKAPLASTAWNDVLASIV